MTWLLMGVIAFVLMEPLTALTHRYVMHGIGWVLHRSHHRNLAARFEANDAFPVMFAAIVIVAIQVGVRFDGLSGLIPIGFGVTAYGAAYALIHDVYIHNRVRLFGTRTVPGLEYLAEQHRLHHRFNAEPYGMLVPVVPQRIRDKQRRADERAAQRNMSPLNDDGEDITHTWADDRELTFRSPSASSTAP